MGHYIIVWPLLLVSKKHQNLIKLWQIYELISTHDYIIWLTLYVLLLTIYGLQHQTLVEAYTEVKSATLNDSQRIYTRKQRLERKLNQTGVPRWELTSADSITSILGNTRASARVSSIIGVCVQEA